MKMPRSSATLVLFLAAFSSLTASTSHAEADSLTETGSSGRRLSLINLSYVLSFPTVSTARFLDNAVSYRGLGVDLNWPTGLGDLHWGTSFRWLYFNHAQDQGTFTTGNTTATGRVYTAVDSFPITANLRYPFTTASAKVLPYIGLGVGAIYGWRELQIGALSKNQYGWQFLLAPEAGTQISFTPTKSLKGLFNVRYDAGFGSDAIDAISYLSLAVGIGSEF